MTITLHRVYERGRLAFELPADPLVLAELRQLVEACRDKHNDYMTLTLARPYKPRTTGKNSQNHKLNGMIMQLCYATGNDYDTIKYCVKMKAVECCGYPSVDCFGRTLPKRERDCNTEECAKLIEACYLLGADMDFVFEE